MRRRYSWADIAATARSTPGRWRLHTHLVAVTPELQRHARRRVPALRPTPAGRFDFRRANAGENEMGHPVFDLYIRWTPKEEPQ